MAEGRAEGRGLHKIWQRGESTSAAAVAAEITEEEEGRQGARLIEEQAPNMRFCTARPDFTSWSGVNSFQVIKHIQARYAYICW